MNAPNNGLIIIDRPRLAAAGLLLLWASLATLVAGMWRYDGALIWLGLLGGIVLGVARWWSVRNLTGLSVSRKRPTRVFAGEPLIWTLIVECNGPFSCLPFPRCLSVRIKDSLLPRRTPGIKLTGLWPGDQAEGPLRTRLFRRGLDKRAEFEAISDFPLGLFEVRARGPIRDLLPNATGGGCLVFPQPAIPETLRRDLDWARSEADFPGRFDPEPGSEFRGVRPYRGGDPVKTVHWGATARVGALMVREWDPPAPRPLRFGMILHTLETVGPSRMLRPDRWEMILRLITGMVVHCRSGGIPLTFANSMGSEQPGDINWMRIPEERGYGAALEWSALAIRSGATRLPAFSAALRELERTCDRVFVLSDVPLGTWRASIAPERPGKIFVCIDAETMATVRPSIGFRSKASDTSAGSPSPK